MGFILSHIQSLHLQNQKVSEPELVHSLVHFNRKVCALVSWFDDDDDDDDSSSLTSSYLYLNTFLKICCNGEFLFTINVLSLNQTCFFLFIFSPFHNLSISGLNKTHIFKHFPFCTATSPCFGSNASHFTFFYLLLSNLITVKLL